MMKRVMTEQQIIDTIHGEIILCATTHEAADRNKVVYELIDKFKSKFSTFDQLIEEQDHA